MKYNYIKDEKMIFVDNNDNIGIFTIRKYEEVCYKYINMNKINKINHIFNSNWDLGDFHKITIKLFNRTISVIYTIDEWLEHIKKRNIELEKLFYIEKIMKTLIENYSDSTLSHCNNDIYIYGFNKMKPLSIIFNTDNHFYLNRILLNKIYGDHFFYAFKMVKSELCELIEDIVCLQINKTTLVLGEFNIEKIKKIEEYDDNIALLEMQEAYRWDSYLTDGEIKKYNKEVKLLLNEFEKNKLDINVMKIEKEQDIETNYLKKLEKLRNDNIKKILKNNLNTLNGLKKTKNIVNSIIDKEKFKKQLALDWLDATELKLKSLIENKNIKISKNYYNRYITFKNNHFYFVAENNDILVKEILGDTFWDSIHFITEWIPSILK